MDPTRPKVALVQDGARGHYGLAMALQNAGLLQAMYTDFFIRKGGMWDVFGPLLRPCASGAFRRMLDRKCPQLASSRVHTNAMLCLRHVRKRKSIKDYATYFQWQAEDLGRWIASDLDPGANILMGFIRHLDSNLCAEARRRGLKTVVDQSISPAFIGVRECQIQEDRFPGWEQSQAADFVRWIDMEERTWANCDAIACPSEYVAVGLREGGIEPGRIHVINYPVDESTFQYVDRSNKPPPPGGSPDNKVITVGFVGQVGLRKGMPYFLQVAKRFPRDKVRFVAIGSSVMTESALAELRRHVEVQAAPRSEVARWLASFDLIYFPTTCEGSAYALMEAMATGLPVVTSPNSGTVARHGIEGFLCAYDDLDTATGYIERLVTDRDLRLSMGKAAAERYRLFNLDKYGRDLSRLMNHLIGAQAPAGVTA